MGLVHLIGVGDVPGVPASDLKVGDKLMWNYSTEETIIAVQESSPKYLQIWTRGEDGREWGPRYLNKNRLVARIQ